MTALCLLGVLAVPSLLASDLPRLVAWPATIVLATAGWWSMARELRRPVCEIVIAADGRVVVDGEPARQFAVEWRGPIAFLRWQDPGGRVQRRSFWPDTLSPGQRRELRLATFDGTAAPDTGGMAH